MIDLFTIFSKGGIVLWYFHGTTQLLTCSVNELIKNVILQEKGLTTPWNHNTVALQYKLDNEFDLVFVYKNDLQNMNYSRSFNDFRLNYDMILKECETNARLEATKQKQPRSYHETDKANSKVSTMIEKKTNILPLGFLNTVTTNVPTKTVVNDVANQRKEPLSTAQTSDINNENRQMEVNANLEKLKMKRFDKNAKAKKDVKKADDATSPKKGKKPTNWDGGITHTELDYSNGNKEASVDDSKNLVDIEKYADKNIVGGMKGELRGIELAEIESDDDDYDSQSDSVPSKEVKIQTTTNGVKKPVSSNSGGLFASLKNLVGAKVLTQETIQPIMEKMQEHLVAKNVASEIAKKLCDNVAFNLDGKQTGSFQSITNIIKQALNDSLVQILTPKKRVDILRDVLDAKKQNRPYVIVFCGVNGVGKSTNLAKVTFWLIENSFNVLIAACDTFRAGAVEQLRTHTKHLNSLHPAEMHSNRQMVQLYEKGYGKDAAGIAMEAINYARDSHIDVVLVDTAGRMQDNEPLMKALAKLININQPDLVLFVGEALVGNEAVDQVRKFNQALYDNSTVTHSNEQARLIDGIVLTKFDTIDDKVGAAISMTYTTGQPIVFVGTGQKYADLKTLNAKSVVQSLLK